MASKQMKLNKVPGLDGLPVQLWKLSLLKQKLASFCNDILHGNRPKVYQVSLLSQRKGTSQYWTTIVESHDQRRQQKFIIDYFWNRLGPIIDKVLRPNKNGFRRSRMSSHVTALKRIVEELLTSRRHLTQLIKKSCSRSLSHIAFLL